MTQHPGEARLNDYLDGELDLRAEADVAEHLAACDACRAQLDGLRRVTLAASSLQDSVQPRRDLWPAIDAGIDTAGSVDLDAWRARRRSALWSHRWELAAAATLLVVLASTGTLLLTDERDDAAATAAADERAAQDVSPVQLVSVPAQADYVAAIQELDTMLRERESQLDPQTAAVVRRNMAIIDQAIREAQQALVNDPANGDLNRAVSSAYKTKINLLRRVVELPART